MIFCTRCRRIVPEGDYCPWCQCSWGVSICEGCHHRNVAGIPSCVQCRNMNLSVATLGIPLGWTATILSALALWGIIRIIIVFYQALLHGASIGGAWLLYNVTGWDVSFFQRVCLVALASVFVICPIIGEMMRRLPSQGGYLGMWLRMLPAQALTHGSRLFFSLLGKGSKGILRLFFGKNKSSSNPPKRRHK
jgi:hypothetical protein